MLLAVQMRAADPGIRFMHYGIDKGLSQNTVFSLTQDASGNMWFATYDGVDRFDGYHFRSYRLDSPNETTTPPWHIDISLFSDSKGNVWASSGVLYKYDGQTDSFVPFEKLKGYIVNGFAEYPQGESILFQTNRGIVPISLKDNAEPQKFLSGVRSCALVSSGKSVAVCAEDGTAALYEDGFQLWKTSFPQASQAKDILVIGDGRILVATDGSGLFCMDGKTVQCYRHEAGKSGSLCSNYVRALSRDANGNIWVGTGNGLSILNLPDGSFSNIYLSEEKERYRANVSVKDIYNDAAGNVWLGTYYEGVWYRYSCPPFFTCHRLSEGRMSAIGGIAEDTDGSLWVGTGRDGLYHYHPDTGASERISLSSDAAEMDDIKAICFDPDGNRIYLGTGLGGLVVYSRQDKTSVRYLGNSCPKSVYSILREGGRYLWLGTLSGLYLFDLKNGAATKVHLVSGDNLFIYSLFRDSSGRIWLGTEFGLLSCRLSVRPDNNVNVSEVVHYDGIKRVQDICQTGSGMWVATRDGLYRQPAANGEWISYGTRDGLSSNIIRGLEPDRTGRLWIGTENGINCLDPRSGRIRRFYKEDGLPGNVMGIYAHCSSCSGKIWFGGLNGLFSFSPDINAKLKESRTPVVASVIVDGETLEQGKREVILDHSKKSLTIVFSVANYSSWQKDVFRYRLMGAQKDWETAGPSHSVSYSNLRPGRYSFELVSENADGVRSQSLSMPVTVLAVWYLSKMAFTIYIILFFLLLAVLISYIVHKINGRRLRDIERIKSLSREDLDRQRALRFADGTKSREDIDFLVKVLKNVDKNISDDKYGVERLASDMCMSRSNLYLRVRDITGESPLDFIHRVRMEKACDLLRETNKPIAEIGVMVGFTSPSYFSASFKKFTGSLPGSFR